MSSKYNRALFCVWLYALFSHIYIILRYGGKWVEEDTSRMVKFAQYVQKENTIFPSGPTYPNGPALSTILTILSDISKVPIEALEIYALPIITSSFILVAYIAFLELTKNKKVALLAAFLLSVQPDFLFTTIRGSHEKFTYTLLLMSIFFLSRSFSRRGNTKEFIYYVLLFYVSVLGMISYNFFFTSTFIFAVTVAFLIGYLISEIPHITNSLKRLTYTSATSTTFFFTYMFYLYPPSRHLLYVFDTLQEKASALFLATEQHVTPQYTYIFNTWPSFKIWLFLTLFNWVIAPLSLAAWIYMTYRFILKKQRLSSSTLLLLLFYFAFSLQLVITILADRFGVFDNLELRIFPVLMFFAIPLASASMMNILKYQKLNDKQQKGVKFFFILLLLVFSVNSLLKATSDPNVSNKWFFYSTHEKESLRWVEYNLQEESIWAGLDSRLIDVSTTYSDISNYDKIKFSKPEKTRYWIISDIIEERAKRIESPLPPMADLPVIYDSGDVQIYENTGELI